MPDAYSSGVEIQQPSLVLDTNAVLDWLVFDEASVLPLAQAITTGRVRWLGTQRMRAELEHVLARPWPARWPFSAEACLAEYDRWAQLVDEPVAADIASAMPACLCTDPDDQVFIDLALASKVKWLISRDLAVLRLSRRLGSYGIIVQRPVDWRWLGGG